MLGTLVGVLPPVALVQVASAADRTARRGDVPASAPQPQPQPSTARVATPLVSVRRLPGLTAGADPAKELRDKLGALAPDVNERSCMVVTVSGTVAYANQPDLPVIPASTAKLVTAAVALDVLGPTYTFKTSVLAVGLPDAAGVVAGDLYLVGGGDPLLSTDAYRRALAADPEDSGVGLTALEVLADSVVAAGIRSVNGSIVGDEGRYDRQYYVARWGGRYKGESAGPSSALAVDHGLTKFSPRVVANEPAVAAASKLGALLVERGVRLAGVAKAGATPREATTLASLASPPLSVVVHQMLALSDNDTAEMLVKEIGLAGKGQGTTAAGVVAMTEKLTGWLTAAGVSPAGIVLYDGSGLSADDRITCAALVTVLGRFPLDSPLVQGLAIAGVHGTLIANLKGTAAEGRLRGKTGTLPSLDLRALAGVLPTADNAELVRFAYVLRRPNVATPETKVDPYWARLVAALVAYPFRPDLTPYAPRPALR